MEVRNLTDYLILLENYPLQQRVLHELAKNTWNDVLIKEKECVFLLRNTHTLIAHREKVLKNIPEISKFLPKVLKRKLINAVYSLQQGYSEANAWEVRCSCALPFSIFNPKAAGEYQIDNFIGPLGHFRELEWAKRFVDDEKQCVRNRFALACLYCFDKTIEHLWHTIKTSGQLSLEDRLRRIKSKYRTDELVVTWAYQLENRFDELIEDYSYCAAGFYSKGFTEAVLKGHEYAARFFWNSFSENVKRNYMDNPDFGSLTDAADDEYAGLVNFIYSLLKEEQKKKLVSFTVEVINMKSSRTPASIYCCLLQSRYYESVLNDILTASFPIPTDIYKWILNSLSSEIAQLQIPLHKMIFEKLWNRLPIADRNEILEDSCIIMNLVKNEIMDLLKIIIPPLPPSIKHKMLCTNWQRAGISALDDFSYRGDFDELRCYLLFFLVDYSPNAKKYILRSNASSIFNNFIKSKNFVRWINKIPKSEKMQVDEVIVKLQENLKVPDQLLEILEEN